MKNKAVKYLVALGSATLLALSSNAATIVDMATYGVGTFNPWLNPSTVDNSFLANMITKYNGGVPTADGETYTVLKGSLTPNPLLPTSTGLSGNVSVGGGPLSFNINLGPTGAGDYLVAGWDGPEGIHAVYYIHGLTGTIDLVNDVPGDNDKGQPFNKKGLSNYWLSDGGHPPTVPDGGTTVVLLGAAVSALGLIRRKLS